MTLSNEQKFLLLCADYPLSNDKLKQAQKLIEQGINIKEVIKLSKYQLCNNTIYLNLKKIGYKGREMNELEKLFYFSLLRNSVLKKELRRLTKKLKEKKIKVILLKGWALKEALGEDFAFQSDIDLLAREKDFNLIGLELKEMGYEKKETFFYKLFKNYSIHVPFIKKSDSFIIDFELHRHLVFPINSFNLDMEKMWHDSKPIKENKYLRSFHPEDQLIHLALHLIYSHSFLLALPNLLRIKKITEEWNINWNKLTERAIEFKVCEIVYYSLFLAQELFEVEIPESTMNKLEKNSKKNSLQFLKNFGGKEILKSEFGLKDKVLFRLRYMYFRFYWTKNLMDKIRLIPFIKGFLFD